MFVQQKYTTHHKKLFFRSGIISLFGFFSGYNSNNNNCCCCAYIFLLTYSPWYYSNYINIILGITRYISAGQVFIADDGGRRVESKLMQAIQAILSLYLEKKSWMD